MKKRMLPILCMMLAMALWMSGCKSKEKEALLGRWRCEIDLTEQINQELPQRRALRNT